MANVSLCTVCVILIVFTLHKPEALCLNIDRSLCLETIVKFMHDQQKCHFNYTHANGLLKDDNVTCQTKCHVAINGISDDQKLGKVELKFGGKINEYEPCISTNTLPVLNMNITCLAWNEVKVPVGGYCTQNEQCQGNENSGVCEHGRCVCRAGYIQYNLKCLEGNHALNQPCSFSEQCAGSPYASCLGGICSCIDGYTAEESTCVQIKVPVGGYCTQNEQCQGHENSGVCEMGRCVCRAGYIQYNLKCLEGNLAFNHPCSFSEHCTGSPYASCLGGKCSCIDGYTAEESTCVQRNIALNQSCSFSEQCTGSPCASCIGGTCSCLERYTAENATSCVQSQKSILSKFQHQEANIGTTLGALFGGLLLGMILTTVALVIIYRQSKTYVNKRDEFNVKFSDNDACSSAKVVDPNAFQNMHTKDEKREVSPYSCSEETSMHNNVYEKLKNGQTQDDVNNHLYEKLK